MLLWVAVSCWWVLCVLVFGKDCGPLIYGKCGSWLAGGWKCCWLCVRLVNGKLKKVNGWLLLLVNLGAMLEVAAVFCFAAAVVFLESANILQACKWQRYKVHIEVG